ncbi:unnamed protein product [Caenorhabditis nigoni]
MVGKKKVKAPKTKAPKTKTSKTKTSKTTTQTGPKKSKKSKTGSMPKSTPSKSKESNSPKKKSLKKLILYGIPILIILTLVAALTVLLIIGKFGGNNVCETKECIMLADHLNNWKDDSVDPCKDFFKYSCGKYNEHNVVEDSQIAKKTFILNGLIKEFLMKNQTTSSKTENAMKHLFWKCKEKEDPTKWNALRKSLILDITKDIKKTLESWPMVDQNWDKKEFSLNRFLSRISSVTAKDKLEISYGIFSISLPAARKLFIKPSTEIYTDPIVIKSKLEQFIWPVPQTIDNDVAGIRWFGEQLLNISNLPLPMSDLKIYTYGDVKTALPDVDFDILIQQLGRHWKSLDITKNKIYGDIGFLPKARLIHELYQNNKKKAVNYLAYKFIHAMSEYIPPTCQPNDLLLPDYMPNELFIRNHFDKEALEDVGNLVEDIRSSFIEMLEKSQWLHGKTRSGAIRKAKGIKKVIAYPKEMEKPGALDKIHNLDILPSDSIYVTRKKIDIASRNLILDYVTGDLSVNPFFQLISNAMYIPTENSINVYAPIMDDPLFHTSFPNYAKIAGVGSIIGHEIGHGFDLQGMRFDVNGNLEMWHDEKDEPEYEKRGMCLVNQYSNYDDPSFGKKLDGNITILEMLADEMGQDAAWKTFKKLDLSQEKKIIGFEDYSMEKLYFQIVATNWCSPRSALKLEDQLKREHPTNSYRVNGVFSNKKEFAETFNCPVGSPMNPVKKCTIF